MLIPPKNKPIQAQPEPKKTEIVPEIQPSAEPITQIAAKSSQEEVQPRRPIRMNRKGLPRDAKIAHMKVGDAVIWKALVETDGYVAHAAEIIGCSINTVYNAIARNEQIAQWIERFKLKHLEEAQIGRRELVKQRFWPAIKDTIATDGWKYGCAPAPSPSTVVAVQQQAVVQQVKPQTAEELEGDTRTGTLELFRALVEQGVVPPETIGINGNGNGVIELEIEGQEKMT